MRTLAFLIAAFLVIPLPAFAAVSNDDRASATAVTALPFDDVLDTTGATVEPGENTSACAPSGATVWYRLDAISSPTVISTEGSDYDTVLTARDGADVVACSDDAIGRQSRVLLDPSEGPLYLQVGGWGGVTGRLHLTIAHAGAIAGTVTAPGGVPVEDLCVEVLAPTYIAGNDVTDDEGIFEIGGLIPGTYTVRGTECIRRRRFAEIWYGGTDRSSATPVAVSPESTTSIVVVATSLATGTISGRVVGGWPNPGPVHACVTAYWGGNAVARAWTDGDGRYETPPLEPEGYFLRFDDRCGLDRIEDEYRAASGPPVWPWWYQTAGAYRKTPVAVVGSTTVIADAVLYVRYDYVDLAVGTPTVAEPATVGEGQRITVSISNLGTVASKAGGLYVTVCAQPEGALLSGCSTDSLELTPLAAGAERTEEIKWTGDHFIGRVDLRAVAYSSDDANHTNDRGRGYGYFTVDVRGVRTCALVCV